MKTVEQMEFIAVDREQMDALVSYAREHRVSLREAIQTAVNALSKPARRRPGGYQGRSAAKTGLPVDIAPNQIVHDVTANLPAGFVSRHPGRDYTAFGSATGVFGDGVEYQKAVREQW